MYLPWNSLVLVYIRLRFHFSMIQEAQELFLLFPQCFLAFTWFAHNDTFWCPWETSLSKTLWEKEKLLVMSNFSFFHRVFYPFGELSAIFIKFEIVICKLSQFGSLKFVVWERVKRTLSFSSNLKLSSANSLGLEASNICCLGKGSLLIL